ncbi:MAG: pilus assembly PilX N-terminal domain-containing protein [Candidatus Eisenbacteria bacterium]|nr:pilus assembly PilX N-terminal domain-containing protein [Candidatus Eisenbacteria bacterium]
MNEQPRLHRTGEAGYVMIAVMVFLVVLLISATAFFTMSTYETKSALYRQESSEAFFLADAAVERARAMFLEDRAWRDGWSGVAAGRGTYDLEVRDTLYLGMNGVVQLVATGHVLRANRRIEVIAEVPPTGLGLTIIQGTASIGGNMCLSGPIHVTTLPFDPSHLTCGGTYTSGFTIKPPYIFTDPAHFPNATYYYVRGWKTTNPYKARVYNRLGVDITPADSVCLNDVTTYNNATQTFTYKFDNDAKITKYFHDVTGVFKRAPGDSSVVVNFGEVPIANPPGVNGVSAVELDGGFAGNPIHATVINTRFLGVTDSLRLNPTYWTGALFTVKQVTMEPYGGVAVVAFDFSKSGGSLVQLGTSAWPAYLYVTHNVPTLTSNFNLVGALTVLGNWTSTGGPSITYDPGFLGNLPPYIEENWSHGVSGTLRVLRWRELAIP